MLKILQISDLHIGIKLQYLGEKAESHRERIWQNLSRVLNLIETEKIELLLICGDVFDHYYPAQSSVERFNLFLTKVAKLNTYIVILPGNHDRLEKSSVFETLVNKEAGAYLKIIKPELRQVTIPELKINIYANPVLLQKSSISPLLGLADLIKSAETQTPDFLNVVMAHGSLDINSTPANYPINLTDIDNLGADYLALGDWHNLLKANTKTVPTWYSGSLEVLAVDQTNSGYALIIELVKQVEPSKESPVKVTPVKLSQLQSFNRELNLDHINITDLAKELTELSDPNALLTLSLIGIIKSEDREILDLPQLEQRLQSKFYYFKLIDKTTLDLQNITQVYPENSIPFEFINQLNLEVEKGNIPAELKGEILHLGLITVNKKS